MEIQKYLETQAQQSGHFELTKDDKKLLNQNGIEEFIFRKLMSKKYRKWSLSESVQQLVKDKIHNCIAENQPIRLTLAYGGFKLWRLPTSPEVDWSEFFYIAYHLKYMAPIAAVYKPGIHLEFSSGDIAVTTMNNVPRSDVDAYDDSLRTLIDIFTPHLPGNITVGSSRLRELFTSEEQFIAEGEKLRVNARKEFANNKHLAKEFHHGAIQNVQLEEGREDLSQLSEFELAVYRERSAEIVFAMYGIPQIATRERFEGINLMATNIDLPIPMITTGCTKYSTAKFWAGIGVLSRNGKKYAEYVLSPKQWEEVKDKPHEKISVSISTLKNLQKISVYPEKFSF